MINNVNESNSRTIVSVGMATRDTYFEMDSLPVEEGKLCARSLGNFCGGMAANVAINLHILGHHVILVHCLGDDPNGKFIKKTLRSHLPDNQIVSSKSSRSFATLVFIEAQTSKRLAILTDGEFSRSLTSPQLSALKQADFIYADGSWPIDGKLLRVRSNKTDLNIMVNLEFPHIHLSKWFEWADIGVHSSSYLGLTEDCTQREIESALRTSCQSQSKLVGVTQGAKGGFFISENTVLEVNAIQVDTIDTNGAGDAFQTGLIHGLMNGWKHEHCLKFAATIAAFQCTVLGPNLGGMTQEQVMIGMEKINGNWN